MIDPKPLAERLLYYAVRVVTHHCEDDEIGKLLREAADEIEHRANLERLANEELSEWDDKLEAAKARIKELEQQLAVRAQADD